jgi:tRNA nucleotidyltransferase/poly(A) polymerase
MILPIDVSVFPQTEGVYIVGGSIRDLLCGRKPKDYDLTVAQDPDTFARSLADRTAGHVVGIGKRGHQVLRVVTGDYFFDIMPLNGALIENDLNRRDFTINAMALEVSSGRLIDLVGGRRDLAAKKVRMVASDVFKQDPLRLVRAYRMAASFGFAIDKQTKSAIARDADLIQKSAGERIREEFFKILNYSGSGTQIAGMADSGVLFYVFPELLPLKNCPADDNQPAFFYERTLVAYDHIEKLLKNRDLKLSKPAEGLFDDIDAERAVLLKWAVLLQNLGRPSVRTTTAGGSAKFYGHAAKSANIAREICHRLRFSRRHSDTIELMIRYHNRPLFLYKARQKNVDVDRAFIRLFMRCGDQLPDILLHALAEYSSRRASEDPSMQNFSDFICESINNYYAVIRPRASQPLPLNGNDLINDFALKPSAAFRRILKVIEEEHLASGNLTHEKALELVEKLLSKN